MMYVTLLLLGSIAAIVLLSSRFRYNTFFVLLLVALVTGLAAGHSGTAVLDALRAGFGGTLEKIGLLILLGAALGAMLDRSHATVSLARFLVARTGASRTPLAVALVGYLVGLPIFCDSGFVVLSGLVLMLSRQTKGMHAMLVAGLAVTLFGVHCLAPPHPGISAAAGVLQVDLGTAMLCGALVAMPAIAVAWLWIRRQSSRPEWQSLEANIAPDAFVDNEAALPAPLLSFLPIAVPITLIALKSLAVFVPKDVLPGLLSWLEFMGDPVFALLCGLIISLFLFEKWDKTLVNTLLDSAIEKSGPILAITAAGGAFGAVIKLLDPGHAYGPLLSGSGLGLWAPFLLAFILKTAQGSSTVAVMTAASIMAPLLPALGLGSDTGHLLALMAMGSGSMCVSHANDSYFWVVSRFGQLPVNATLRVYSSATFWMGLTAFLSVWLLSMFI